MRKGWRVWGIAGLLLVLPVMICVCAFALPAQYSRSYPAALCDKAEMLHRSDAPRIVVTGGSGAAFDIDSDLLESEFPGYKAVNFGLYAGLGTTVMLELALPDLRDGDVVVFMPEVSAQTLSDWFGAETMWQASEENTALLTRLDASRFDALLAALPRYAAQKARFAVSGNAPQGDPVYARSSFSEKGDILPELRPANRMPGGWDVNTPVGFDSVGPTEEFIECVNAFVRACRDRGVRVFFRFCPMNEAAVAEGVTEQTDAFEEWVRKALDCEVLGSVRRAVMEPGWFFDTNFHLNAAGAALNTILLAEELKAALGDETSVSAVLPEMPFSENETVFAGDDRDADCFLYEEQDGALIITGLSETGWQRASLTVPASRSGKAVTALAKNAFAGAENLESVTLQASLRTIQDGAFAGCDRLREIILLQGDPGYCTVGTGLLEGTDAVVVVPADRYGNYCTNYFWAVHASRLRPTEGPETAVVPAALPAPAAVSERPKSASRITYDGNGGTLRGQAGDRLTRDVTYAHRRENTLQGTVWFHRDGCTLTGWNTASDGTGISVGLGSRHDPADGDMLYAQWEVWSPDGDFDWTVTETAAAVAGWHGTAGTCVIPEEYAGLPVRTVCAGAFREQAFVRLVLPPSLRMVEEGAFADCAIDTLVLYDSLDTVSGAGFAGCDCRTLRVNAAVSPVYSGSYFDTFQDKLDYLRTLRGQRKLVLSSGSSGRYGYNSEMLAEAFLDLAPVNMGVYAYTNALPQLSLILPLVEEGDILLYAPEFDAVREQFCVSNALDKDFWAMMESDYDTAVGLDMRSFTCVFDSFGEYLRVRKGMPRRGYELSASNYDDDGNYYAFSTYNKFGDFILPRPNGDTDERLRHNIADYTLDSFPQGTVEALNAALAPFAEKGVMVWFGYTPRNSASLTEKSTPEARAGLEEYLRETLAVPVISRMEDSLMAGRYFWLIDSHLSTEGARLRTEQVIHDLRVKIAEQTKETEKP